MSRPVATSLALVLLASGVTQAQSLGEIAARERERRKALEAQGAGGKGKTVTEEGLSASRSSRPERYTAPDGGFKIYFPGPPEVTEKTTSSGTPATTYKVAYSNIALTVSTMVLSESDVGSRTTEQLLGNIKDIALSTMVSASLVSEQAVTRAGVAGKEFTLKFSARRTGREGILRCLAFISGRRVYQAVVMASPENQNDPIVDRFLASFEVKQ